MTIAVDFDGVLHSYEHGWAGGAIYGRLLPGAAEALRYLMVLEPVFIHTSRNPECVGEWIANRTGIRYLLDVGETFWEERGVLLVTDRKLPARVYIDDRGLRFECWEQAIYDMRRLELL